MKIFKLIISSLLLFVLIVPLFIFAYRTVVNYPSHVQEFLDSGYDSTWDFYAEWCPENEWGYPYIKKMKSWEERIHNCHVMMQMDVNTNRSAKEVSLVATIILSIMLIFYSVFYIRWLKKSYF
tara:strand:+ start:1103 stop:1471 length:369 start_codon:yes stop_codon:yes gene_type:complete